MGDRHPSWASIPYAPSQLQIVDPYLPAWLPAMTIRGLQVGTASVTIEFRRRPTGETTHRVVHTRGTLHVIRQASPWSLTEPLGRRLRHLLGSVVQ